MLLGTFCVKGFRQTSVFVSLQYVLGVELLGHLVTTCDCERTCQTPFQSSCAIVHPHQLCLVCPFCLFVSKLKRAESGLLLSCAFLLGRKKTTHLQMKV